MKRLAKNRPHLVQKWLNYEDINIFTFSSLVLCTKWVRAIIAPPPVSDFGFLNPWVIGLSLNNRLCGIAAFVNITFLLFTPLVFKCLISEIYPKMSLSRRLSQTNNFISSDFKLFVCIALQKTIIISDTVYSTFLEASHLDKILVKHEKGQKSIELAREWEFSRPFNRFQIKIPGVDKAGLILPRQPLELWACPP